MGQGSEDVTEDVIGQIQFEFVDWQKRRPASKIMDEIRQKTADIPGIKVEVTAPRAGPPTGKPIQIQLSSDYRDALDATAREGRGGARQRPEIRDLDNGLPMPGIDWRLEIDKAEAAKYGIGVTAVGSMVQLVTNGMKVTDYRPQTSDKPVDIIVRVPEDRRTLSSDRRPAGADADRLGADRQLHQAGAGAPRRPHPSRRRPARRHRDRQRRRRRQRLAVVQQRITAELAKTDFRAWSAGS